MAGKKGVAELYRLAFPSMRQDVEDLYPGMSTKAKKHLTALRVKRKSREAKQEEEPDVSDTSGLQAAYR
jgi:hypothetical protein